MGSCALLDGKEASSPRTGGALSSSEVAYVGGQETARMAWPKWGAHFSVEAWTVFDFQTEAGQSGGPTWATLVEGGNMFFAVDIG